MEIYPLSSTVSIEKKGERNRIISLCTEKDKCAGGSCCSWVKWNSRIFCTAVVTLVHNYIKFNYDYVHHILPLDIRLNRNIFQNSC